MDKTLAPKTPANCSPAFSIAGAVPAASNMTWKTAYPNPDSLIAAPRPAGHGPTFTIAGVVPAASQTAWRTAMPDPTRDVLDSYGHVITKIEAATRAELATARKPGVLTVRAGERHAA